MDIKNKRILVVEDQPHLVDHVCCGLRSRGAVILGPAPTSFYATQLLAGRGIDAAILDIWLHGSPVFGLANMLADRGTPFILATDGDDDDIPPGFVDRPRIKKPYELESILGLVTALIQEALPSAFRAPVYQNSVEISLERGDSSESTNRNRLYHAITTVMRRKVARPH